MSGTEGSLRGRRVLVAEDEYFIADEIMEALERLGAEVVGPVSRVSEALAVAEQTDLDGAILDVNLAGEMIWPVVEALTCRGVPIVLATGYDAGGIPPAHAHLPRCEKPAEARAIAAALAGSMAAGRERSGVRGGP